MDPLRKLKRIRFWVLLIAGLVIFGSIIRACSDPEPEPGPASDQAGAESASTGAAATSVADNPITVAETTTSAAPATTTTVAEPVPTTLAAAPASTAATTTTAPAGSADNQAPTTLAASPVTATSAVAGEEEGRTQVVRVIDGDTIAVLWNGEETRVRLIGINTPESGECLAQEAGRRLEELLDGEVRLETDEEETDRFGRMLAYIWAGDVLVNERLAAEGLALARAYPPNISHQAVLDAAEADARREGAGMWAPDACGPPAGAELEITEIRWNPPGPDGDNLNGEYLVVRNVSAGPARLDGFTLRDSSSSNRFRFPDGWTLPGGAEVVIHSGSGRNDQDSLFWESDLPIWNNGGDEAFLLDPSGNIIAYRSYTG